MSAQDPRPRQAVTMAGVLALVFVAGTVAAPLLVASGSALGGWLHVAYSPTCHQMAERSLTVAGVAQPVCARCSGLYVGGVLGLFAALPLVIDRGLHVHRMWLLAAAVPSLIDFALPWIGIPGVPNVPRFLLALPAGFAAALFLAIGIADLFVRKPVPVPVEVVDG